MANISDFNRALAAIAELPNTPDTVRARMAIEAAIRHTLPRTAELESEDYAGCMNWVELYQQTHTITVRVDGDNAILRAVMNDTPPTIS